MNGIGVLVLAGVFALVMYGITVPAFAPRKGTYTLGRWIGATISALAITLAVWALIMFQAGVWPHE
jgi:hypothetical protein